MSIRTICFGGLLASLLLVPQAVADMGRVYVSTTGVTVSEDAQKAIILHNGREEVLILGTELRADRPTPIIRFIPFPSEPQVSLAPPDVFRRLAAIVDKYKLQYVYAFHSKGGRETSSTTGVEVRLSVQLGAHDLTVIQVHDPAVFRYRVNDYFRNKHLPYSSSYPAEEAVVADYVKRGIEFFVLDYVDLPKAKRFIDPVLYRFKTASLYYPLKTSNTFGGKGEIELFIVSPATLCIPGSAILMDQFDQAVNTQGHAAGNCLNLPVKASTSAMLVPEENDLPAIYPDAAAFFGRRPVFIQSIRYVGDYKFNDDVLVPLPQGVPKALGVERYEDTDYDIHSLVLGEDRAVCRKEPEAGPCKGRFESYYFDQKSRSCKMFFWGGCQGVVPFQTLEECKAACMTRLPH
ncbi:MAG: DUF2330 domain-containing protein [Alphaproteobacteria bacterium]|nr:DUF2330 domain-containing protein [Alphaproteobacteria bacterium]MDE2500587.1 DUF2330 domain-containing protein [Alphaproteobacteria bacterium]